MTLSFNKLNEIAELYESIAFSEQEVLNEFGGGIGGQAAVDAVNKRYEAQKSARNAPMKAGPVGSGYGGGNITGAPVTVNSARQQKSGTAPTAAKYKSSSDGKMYANYNDAKAARNSRLKDLAATQAKPTPTRTPAPAPTPTRTPAPAPTPKATTPAKPATPAPTSTSAKTSPTAAPARNGFGTSTSSMGAKSSVSSATEPATTPAKRPSLASQNAELRAMQASSRQRQGLTQSFDIFDVVLGHLIDEGYADTEEAATAIMANMSEDWRESIVEEVFGEDKKYDANRKRAAQRAAARNAARDAGKTGAVPGVGYVTPRRESETYRDSAGVERHKSGAKNA